MFKQGQILCYDLFTIFVILISVHKCCIILCKTYYSFLDTRHHEACDVARVIDASRKFWPFVPRELLPRVRQSSVRFRTGR